MLQLKPEIPFEDFQKLDVRVGTIISCEPMAGSDKLFKLRVELGELGEKQVMTGLRPWYSHQDLINLKTLFILNLPPRKMMGEISEGMILAVDGEVESDKPILIHLPIESQNGAILR